MELAPSRLKALDALSESDRTSFSGDQHVDQDCHFTCNDSGCRVDGYSGSADGRQRGHGRELRLDGFRLYGHGRELRLDGFRLDRHGRELGLDGFGLDGHRRELGLHGFGLNQLRRNERRHIRFGRQWNERFCTVGRQRDVARNHRHGNELVEYEHDARHERLVGNELAEHHGHVGIDSFRI